jgi:hypothetical protein
MGQAFRDIRALVGLTYRDTLRLIRALWWVIGLLLLAILVGAVPGIFLSRFVLRTDLGQDVFSTLCAVGGLWLAAPYLASIFRFVLTGNLDYPETLRGSPAVNRLFAWAGVLLFITALPNYAYSLLTDPSIDPAAATTPGGPVNVPQTLVTFALLVGTWIFGVRTITLLPAAASGDAVTLREALEQTRRRFWFIVGASIAVAVPCAFGGAILTVLVVLIAGAAVGGALSIVISAATILSAILLGLSLSARLYQKFALHPVDLVA